MRARRAMAAMAAEPGSGPLVGVLLAGGLARRMGGGDKPLRELGGITILERVIARARDQTDVLVLNANGDPARFATFGLPVVAAGVPDLAGPLAGVLAGLDWAAVEHPDCHWVVIFATDTPFLPADLVSRLCSAVQDGAALACAASAGRSHPVFGLWPVSLRDALRAAMVEEAMRKIDAFTARYGCAVVEFETQSVDPFFNANKPDDLAEAEALLERLGSG